jgi:hypothetical protein
MVIIMPDFFISKDLERMQAGKAFIIFQNNPALLAAGVDNIVIHPHTPMSIRSITVTSNSEILTWQAWGGTQWTENGTDIDIVHRNQAAARDLDAHVQLNPTISDDGTPFFANPVELIGQSGAGTRSYIDSELLSGPFKFKKDVAYLIRITNTDAATRKYTLSLNMYEEEN